jgi:hypothetical protein
MPERCLVDVITPIVPQALYFSLKVAAPQAVGCELSRESLLVLLAQIDEETGWKSCHAHNLGNIKHVPGDGHDYVQFHCTEMINGKEVPFNPPDPASSFRAYPTLDAACVDYLFLLKRQFGLAWPAVIAGDAAQFAHLLRIKHYYTADEGKYTAAVVAIDAWLDHVLLRDPPPPVPFTGALQVASVDEQPTPPGDLPPAADS